MRAILRDAASGKWRLFERPRELVVARTIDEVMPALRRIDVECANGAFAAGFLAYEAAPAFDSAFRTRHDEEFPFLWFGLYERFHELPQEAIDRAEMDSMAIDWTPSIDTNRYEEAFNALQELIREGHTYQVNFTYRLQSKAVFSPWALFQQLVSAQPSPYAAYLHAGEWVICSASPELFFEKHGDTIESKPMKGTASRGLWYEQDIARANGLQASEKERAENVMIVDMVRNDLGRIARPGSVNVTRLFDVERYPTVWQMTSTVKAKADARLPDVIAALFPPASITGAPKASTMSIISKLECSPRRIYTGTIGFIDPDGRAQFNVAIRTALINRKTGEAEYGVGGGIVADSNVRQERAEAELKSKVLVKRMPGFDLLETMLWKPGESFALLNLHLQRLTRSAEYFGFDLDAGIVRRELERFERTLEPASHKVRMLVSRTGAVELKATLHGPESESFAPVALAARPIDPDDPFLYHKTTNRRIYEEILRSSPGMTDVLLYNPLNEVTESTIANLIVELDGELVTPPIECGLLPGTARAQLLSEGRICERRITIDDLALATRLYLVNSVRGLQPIRDYRFVPAGSSL